MLLLRKATVAISFVFAITTCALAKDAIMNVGGIEYVIPANSPVHFSSLHQQSLVATFAGRFTLTGTYHYGYITKEVAKDSKYDERELSFAPDANLAAVLPYWRDRGRVIEIRFRNEQAFITAVIPSNVLTQLNRRTILSTSGRVSIQVTDYQATVECDSPAYEVRFVSVAVPMPVRVSQNTVDESGC